MNVVRNKKTRINYRLKDILNPGYVGLISTPIDDGYIFEDMKYLTEAATEVA